MAGFGLALGVWGCQPSTVFHCSHDADCSGLAQGVCQPDGYCSTPDSDCVSGYRYGEHVGDGLAGKCVPSTAGSGSTSGGGSSTSGPTTTVASTTATTSTSASTSSGPGTGSTSGPATTADTGTTMIPSGKSCSSDADCEPGLCFSIPTFGGYCGECKSDADCSKGGCTIPNPNANPPAGSVCNSGELGDGCQSDDVCTPNAPHCVTLVDASGVFEVATCSPCAADDQCPVGTLCSPMIQIQSFAGHTACVDPGSVALGDTCDYAGSGDQACASGICAQVSVMAVLSIGVCSECTSDSDCMASQTCHPASIDLMQGATPGTCG